MSEVLARNTSRSKCLEDSVYTLLVITFLVGLILSSSGATMATKIAPEKLRNRGQRRSIALLSVVGTMMSASAIVIGENIVPPDLLMVGTVLLVIPWVRILVIGFYRPSPREHSDQ